MNNRFSLKYLLSKYRQPVSVLNELLWADIFHDTILDSDWLLRKNFSPGRWAVGYEFLYALYRILDSFRPKNILELGLGESTHMISQYVSHNGGVAEHIVIEHDSSWIDFYKKRRIMEGGGRTKIIQKELKNRLYNGKEVVSYKDFSTGLESRKFDFISVDGPFGSDFYSRIDILDMIPESLDSSFVIIMDDCERDGERNTKKEILKILSACGIGACEGIYGGLKTCCVITTEDNKFLCSL